MTHQRTTPSTKRNIGDMPRRWLTRTQTAELIQTSERYIDKLIANGELTAFRIGKKIIRLDASEVDALLKPIATAGGER